jgi:meso-butanediol dehydrogenase / (S,S)-butanediol dehydrogenase / diacetyl reductase
MRLANKTALITGGTSGIGQATVELFIAEGAQVAFTGRRMENGRQLAKRTGARFMPTDHRLQSDCARCVDETLAAFGRIDILFNNAGIVVKGTAEEVSQADWDETLLLNVTGVWWMSRLVLPIFRQQGRGVIVNNASDWGVVGGRDAFAYSASKGAVIQMTRSMALDYARQNIRINAVCPGDTFVERWVTEGYFKGCSPANAAEAHKSDDIPMGRVGEVSEIAKAVLFLASDESSFMTGAALLVDGGNTAQ